MLGLTKNEIDPLALSPIFAKAQRAWAKVDGKRNELNARIEGIKLALSLAQNPDNRGRVPPHLIAQAEPYAKQAEDDPDALIKDLARTEDALRKLLQSQVPDGFETYQAACRTETNRIARELQPRHREIALRMSKAVEDLSASIADERALLADLERLAPERQSAHLPNLGEHLCCGTLGDMDGLLVRWRRNVQRLGIFEKDKS